MIPDSFNGRRRRHSGASALVVEVAPICAALSLVAAFAAAPLTRVSGPSPFVPGCDGLTLPSGENYLNAEVEPRVAVNPTTPLNIVGVWQQDRWSDSGSHGIVAGVSHNGGSSWTRSFAPFSRCAGGTVANGGDYERASDPWVSFAPNGEVYQVSLSLGARDFPSSSTVPEGEFLLPGTSAVLVSKSIDGGDTWSDPVTLIRDAASNVLNDKESITADSTDSAYVYAVWHRIVFPLAAGGDVRATVTGSPSCNGCRGPDTASQPRGVAKAQRARRARGVARGERIVGYHGPTWLSRTRDGGKTWERARIIFDPGQANQTMANQIVVLPNGDLVNGFALLFNHPQAHEPLGMAVAVIRSTNKGNTWTKAITIDAVQSVGVRDPATGQPVRSGGGIPDFAVDRVSGHLYAVWQDARFSNFHHDDIVLSKSTDGGLTWSAPLRINQTPTNIAPGNQQAFTSSVYVADDGAIGVAHYDFRRNTSDAAALWTDYWLLSSHDGGETWKETHIAGPFDIKTAPVSGGLFLGDYQGLASAGGSFVPFFVMANSGDVTNRTDVFTAIVGP